MSFDQTQRRELLAIARKSIEYSLPQGDLAPCLREQLLPYLTEPRSCFVTLRIDGELRGCCGTLDASRSLAEDVWRNAWASAFSDPRFPRLSVAEWPRVDLHISVLSNPEPLLVANEQDLLQRLRRGVDGLIFELGGARATFLPVVWQQIPDPVRFVRQLKLKAGWPGDFWSPELRAWRYATEGFGEREGMD